MFISYREPILELECEPLIRTLFILNFGLPGISIYCPPPLFPALSLLYDGLKQNNSSSIRKQKYAVETYTETVIIENKSSV